MQSIIELDLVMGMCMIAWTVRTPCSPVAFLAAHTCLHHSLHHFILTLPQESLHVSPSLQGYGFTAHMSLCA